MTPARVEALRQAVQHNCDIADARHAADLPLCQFLLQMRELYRWRQGLDFATVPPRAALGAWLAERERAWDALEAEAFVPLPVGPAPGAELDPFDLDAINDHLVPHGWVYGAGHVDAGRPGFFLAELLRHEAGPPVVQHCGHELARGLFAPPAALQGGHTIVLRRDALARWLWMLWEGFALQRPAGAFAVLMQRHGARDTAGFIVALPALTDVAARVTLWHERGETAAAMLLEPGWAALRQSMTDRRANLQLRALRDLIADARVTLPALLDADDADGLHFWFATFEGLRTHACPDWREAYTAWCAGDGGDALRAACAGAAPQLVAQAQALLASGTDLAAVMARLQAVFAPR
ncbi:Sfum_1244 family protein [Rubrivivax albus]|uniref:Uncharacterized protein n=1 Tax=Rubrivivax albus TaxID=2499835 RepID=A0A3S2TN01_9BURK|nr:Sfum_1244 family protein [Rubrivivax albus]RVT52380.1 hypothetical protein ENE75_08035 [Rubrivivax albus]